MSSIFLLTFLCLGIDTAFSTQTSGPLMRRLPQKSKRIWKEMHVDGSLTSASDESSMESNADGMRELIIQSDATTVNAFLEGRNESPTELPTTAPVQGGNESATEPTPSPTERDYKPVLDPDSPETHLPKPCADFFMHDCKLDIPPDGDNITEVKDAFVCCCEDSKHGGHKAGVCHGLADEIFTKSHVTEEECKALVEMFKANQDLQEDKHKEEFFRRQGSTHERHHAGLRKGRAESANLDSTLTRKDEPVPTPDAPAAQNGQFKLNEEECLVQGNDGNSPIIIFYHGMENTCGQCPHVLTKLQNAGYTVVSPCGHDGPFLEVVWNVGDWANNVFNAVRAWQPNRKIGVLGYSMGGGAAIKVSYDNGDRDAASKVPAVAFHPASLLAGPGVAEGPSLYITGDGEDEAGSRRYVWTTSSWSTWNTFQGTHDTKLYLKFQNADHGYPCWQSPPVDAAVRWFNCHIKDQGCTNPPSLMMHGIPNMMENIDA